MKRNILPITEAKVRLLELTRLLEEGQSFVLTKNGLAVGALIPMEDFESFRETVDILNNPLLMRRLHKALKEEKKGKLWKKDSKAKWVSVHKKH